MRFIASMIGVLICVGGWQILDPMMVETPVRGVIGVGVIVIGVTMINEFRPGRKVE